MFHVIHEKGRLCEKVSLSSVYTCKLGANRHFGSLGSLGSRKCDFWQSAKYHFFWFFHIEQSNEIFKVYLYISKPDIYPNGLYQVYTKNTRRTKSPIAIFGTWQPRRYTLNFFTKVIKSDALAVTAKVQKTATWQNQARV